MAEYFFFDILLSLQKGRQINAVVFGRKIKIILFTSVLIKAFYPCKYVTWSDGKFQNLLVTEAFYCFRASSL